MMQTIRNANDRKKKIRETRGEKRAPPPQRKVNASVNKTWGEKISETTINNKRGGEKKGEILKKSSSELIEGEGRAVDTGGGGKGIR